MRPNEPRTHRAAAARPGSPPGQRSRSTLLPLRRPSGHKRVPLLVSAAGLGLIVALGGCAGGTANSPTVVAVPIAAPLHEMVWSASESAIVGLTDAGSKVEVVAPRSSSQGARSMLSSPFSSLGRDIAINRENENLVYVPEPATGVVAELDVRDLRRAGTLHVGNAPDYLATDEGANVLLALSADGSTVTGVSLRTGAVLTTQRVDAGSAAEIEGPARERLIEYHVVSTAGVVHYLDKKRVGAFAVDAGESAGDQIKVTRLYVAERGTDRLLALDSGRTGDGMLLVGSAELGAPVEEVGTDAYRIYAATDTQLVVLRSNTFRGYSGGRIPVLASIPYRSALPADARGAAVDGLVVGRDRVYLSFAGQPYLLAIAKPDV